MGTLKGFLNPKKIENIKFVVSNRFVDFRQKKANCCKPIV